VAGVAQRFRHSLSFLLDKDPEAQRAAAIR